MRYLLQKTVSSEEKMMFMRNRFLALFWAMAMLAFAIPSAAAPIKVKGSVTDEKGEPMMGAIIVANPRPHLRKNRATANPLLRIGRHFCSGLLPIFINISSLTLPPQVHRSIPQLPATDYASRDAVAPTPAHPTAVSSQPTPRNAVLHPPHSAV